MSTTTSEAPSRVTSIPVAKPSSVPSSRRSDEQNEAKRDQVSWVVIGWLTVAHVGALFAPFTFTWQALTAVIILHWLTGGVGICLGFHRLLTHASFKTHPWVRWTLAWIGGLAGEGSAIGWVADHRMHHANSDHEGDPHSPTDGAWWSHVFWLAWKYSPEASQRHVSKWAPDLQRDPVLRFLHKTFLLWHFVLGFALFGIGYAIGGSAMGWSFVVWGVFLRMTLVLHTTWFVNSASHMWGYQNYKTTDQSRNNWWVALIAYGEGWHNNHHAYPRMAPHGHKWWEFDITFRTIRLMQLCGLAWDVVDYKVGSEKDRIQSE